MLTPARNPILEPEAFQLSMATLVGDGGRTNHLTHRHRIVKRDYVEPFRVTRAKEQIDRLPQEGEAIHCIQAGDFALCDLIPAILEMAAPATCTRLVIATLSFNRKNRDLICELIDTGKIGPTDVLISTIHEKNARADCQAFADALQQRGGRFLAVRCHAKVQTMDMSDGEAYVVEGSANLRSCRCIEQFVMTNDRDLLHFHNAWIDEIFRRAKTEDRHQIGASARKQRTAGSTKTKTATGHKLPQ